MWTPVCMEPPLGYHPCGAGFLTRGRERSGDNVRWEFDWGGRLRKYRRRPRFLRMVGNHSKSAKAEGSLTATPTGGAGTKVGLSDPVEFKWECHRSTDKSYPGDNRLITPKSSHRRSGLAPRCRLIASWG